MPGQYTYEYRGTRLMYEYPTLSVKAFSDEELENSPNPFAQVIVAARIRLMEEHVPDDQLLDIKLLAAKRLMEKGFDKKKVRAIFNFLRNYVLFEKPETSRKFDNQFRKTDKADFMNTDEYLKMEGKEEGLAEEREGTVRRLLEDENLNLSLDKIASLTNVPIKVVQEIKEELGVR